MADITMCKGDMCPNKNKCYRYTATVNPYRQSFFMTTPIKDDGSCDEFWEDPYKTYTKDKK